MTQPLAEFRIERPRDVASALRLGAVEGSQYLAGGTDLIVNLRRGHGAPPLLVDLGSIAELDGISCGGEGARLGAGVRLASLCKDDALLAQYPAIGAAAAAIAGPGHRNLATLGGNLCLDTRCVYYNQSEWWRAANGYCLKRGGEICHVAPQGRQCRAAYSGDLAPALLVHAAEVEIAGAAGWRRPPLAELYRDDGRAHLALAAGELLVAVHLPPARLRSAYRKASLRRAVDFPLAGVAVALAIERGCIAELHVAVTGTNPRPLLIEGTSDLAGAPADETAAQRLGKLVQAQVEPVRTTTSPAQYRRAVAAALAGQMLRDLAAAG
ncbi:MAG: 4-hydroxybenzoyl-CoA reductase subunit beta [Steroidobacteraceae bacterium]